MKSWLLKCINRVGNSTLILCLARGGLRPGDILSRIFSKPLAIMSTSSYRAEAGTVQGHLDIARFITTPKGEMAGKVLLVDDLADSGHTLRAVIDMLRTNYAPITELRSAVIWTKVCRPSLPTTRWSFCRPIRGFISPLRVTTAWDPSIAGEVESLN